MFTIVSETVLEWMICKVVLTVFVCAEVWCDAWLAYTEETVIQMEE